MEKEQFLAVLTKYLEHRATPEEEQFLYTYYRLFLADADVLALLEDQEKEKLKLAIKAGIDQSIDQTATTPVRRFWPRIAAAASILLVLGTGAYFLLHHKQPVQVAVNDVAPYSQQAVLKTGHGITLKLDSTHKGLLAQYANTNIRQSNSDQVAYTNSAAADEKVVFDTLQVPAGGKPYHLTLADGSQIVVNVASAVRFPENFRKNNNEVQLIEGEAYFAIIHNQNAPLTIKAKDQLIEDIGTEFNVNTYDDEPDRRTTLIAGAVKVNARKLVPGEQAIVVGKDLTIATADLEKVTGWLKGDFVFNGDRVQEVMQQLARWYNIDVHYQGKIPNVGFFLKISRSKNISEVLNALERSTNKVHFKLEGRRITVSAKK